MKIINFNESTTITKVSEKMSRAINFKIERKTKLNLIELN